MRLAVILALLIAGQTAPSPVSPFTRKYNAFADQMNTVAAELQLDIANRRDMVRAAKLWKELSEDEGWLK